MTTRIQFYHNASDIPALACELVERAYMSGRQVAVRIPDGTLARRFDLMLWTRVPLSFVPHVPVGTALAAETPVVIDDSGVVTDWPHLDMLFNLAHDVPPGFERFRMVVEIVGQNETDKAPARKRWLHYKEQQCAIKAFDAVQRVAI